MHRSTFLAAVMGTALLLSLPAPSEGIVHEKYEWSDMWVTNADVEDGAPRVLLVGDSIVRGYFGGVEKNLGEGVNCARYTTSKFLSHPDFLTELGVMIKRFQFDVIHVNNGLHGWGYTEAQYEAGMEALISFLKKESPESTIVWCMTTPVRDSKDLTKPDADKQARVEARNAIAAALMKKHGISVNDLHAVVVDDDGNFSPDGVHFSEAGREKQAKRVAEVIQPLLPGAQTPP
jgi:hypothetical protein